MLGYEELLERAYALLPEKAKEPARFEMPKAVVEIHGKNTIIKNAAQIVQYLRRDIMHFLKYFCKELGTTGGIEGGMVRLKGKFGPASINKKVEDYVKEFVLCPMCGKPDTHFEELQGVRILKCEACGAISPVREI